MEAKVRKWVELIQSEKLKEVAQEVQEISCEIIDERTNQFIFKLLLYLAHTADKCNKEVKATGREIYLLASILCSTLISIPDSNKFISSLFHIIRCLLTMHMYKEASQLCIYLRSEHLSHANTYINDVILKVAHLWNNATNKMFHIIQQDPQKPVPYKEVQNIIQYELKAIETIHENYIKHLLAKISLYIDKLAQMNRQLDTILPCLHDLIIKHLTKTQISLNQEEKYATFRYMLHILTKLMSQSINEKGIKITLKSVREIQNCFRNTLHTDAECYQCFVQFENMCSVLLKPVEELTEDTAKTLHETNENYLKIAKAYGYTGAIKWTALNIAEVLEPLLVYWEICLKQKKASYLNNNILQSLMSLVMHVSIFFIKQTWEKCKCCNSEECRINRDIYNAVVLKARCINLISKFSSNDVSKETCTQARKILEQNITSIYEMKQSKCKCWAQLWNTSGILIYNMGIICEKFYEESAVLFSLLCTCIVKFEGLKHKYKYISMQNPLSATLHRLSSVHYTNGKYREAMTASALNGLFSYNDPNSKAFRMWANIKYKSLSNNKIMEMSMVECLETDKGKIEELGLYFELEQYDLVQLCIREAKGLHEAKVNLSMALQKVFHKITEIRASPIERAYVVQLLALHLLSFNHENDIAKYIEKSISELALVKSNAASLLCYRANLEFYNFVNELRLVNKKTHIEMENTKFALYAPKVLELGDSEAPDVVPAYSKINVKEDSRLVSCLQRSVKMWVESFQQDFNDIVNGWEPSITLRTLIIAGEYARLYRYEDCEIRVWSLAYRLATELQDYRAIIYTTGRSISLRQFNNEWVAVAKNLVAELKNNADEDIIDAIAIFWISLADYYFECQMQEEAKNLLNDARSLPGISFLSNIAIYLYSLDRILCNFQFYKEDLNHEQYTQYLVETLYAMVNLNEELETRKWRNPPKHLFSYDVLFSTVVNLSLRMNSLLSFREISAHLVRRLRTAQSLGATLRVAELLKSLCYIDLSRSQLGDCEVKLQGLENVLNVEAIQSSMNTIHSKLPAEYIMTTPTRVVDPVRDIQYNGSSPVLKNKVFDLPEFLLHKNCKCYSCTNVSYQYLVFACTHIRAQLYALQNTLTPALEHFNGAFQIYKKLMTKPAAGKRTVRDLPKNELKAWQERYFVVDYVLLLFNFAYFLENKKRIKDHRVTDILLMALKTCHNHKLRGHPIYVSLREFILTNRFQRIFSSEDSSTFTVPNKSDIDISKYVEEAKPLQNICTTPIVNNTRTRKPKSIRRNRTPPLLKLTKVKMDYSDEESSNQSPPVVQRKRTRRLTTRRKLSNEDYTDLSNTDGEGFTSSENKSLTDATTVTRKSNSEKILIKDTVGQSVPTIPELSEHVDEAVDDLKTLPATNNIQEVIEKMENLEVAVNLQTKERVSRRTRQSKQSNTNDYDNKIRQAVKLFKDITIKGDDSSPESSTKDNISIGSIIESTPPRTRSRRILQNQDTNIGGNVIGKSSLKFVPYNEYDADNKMSGSETSGTRTRSTKRTVGNKDSQTQKRRLRKI